jgi:hypothetical protein
MAGGAWCRAMIAAGVWLAACGDGGDHLQGSSDDAGSAPDKPDGGHREMDASDVEDSGGPGPTRDASHDTGTPSQFEDAQADADAPARDGGGDGGPAHSFAAAYAVIAEHCAPCHHPDRDGPDTGESEGIGYSLGHLDMSTAELAYANLVGSEGTGVLAAGIHCGPPESTAGYRRVVPGDPANSLIINKLSHETPECGVRMPDGLPPLDAGLIAIIAAWIEAGAPND